MVVISGKSMRILILTHSMTLILFASVLRIAKTPLPFSYFVHLRTMIVVYLFVVPFSIAERGNALDIELSLFSQLSVMFFLAYSILGAEQCALKLETPYGLGASSLPQENFCNIIFTDLMNTLDTHADSIDNSLLVDLDAEYGNSMRGSDVSTRSSTATRGSDAPTRSSTAIPAEKGGLVVGTEEGESDGRRGRASAAEI
jgi:hypothetical protein